MSTGRPEVATMSSKFANDRWSVLVVHPKVRWGSGSASVLKQADRQLEEAVALVNNLPNMIAVDSLIMPVDYNTKRKSVWASGNLEKLIARRETARATALMVNVDVLSPSQQEELFRIFEVPVFDRYNIVLSTFKEFARTDEARIQIALAEIPYIKHRIHALASKRLHSRPEVLHIEQQYAEVEGDLNEILRKKEQDLRRDLKEATRKSSEQSGYKNSSDAVVAVVGYTNAGKTSLVKRLTGAASLNPKDQLFATLDTTRHVAKLPSGRSAVFTDTIGFLSDLPMHLISAFEATLAHVKTADVIIHLRDVSNPDWKAQEEDVVATLKSIGVANNVIDERMITVDNKIDKEGAIVASETCNSVRISCKTGEGMHQLIDILNEKVSMATKCKTIRLRLDVRSPVIEWLYHNEFVVVEPVADGNSLIFDVVMNESEIGRFRKKFAHLRKKPE
uniref:Hflx-type G domain-containing protein n=1 Tax=Caenorhabditis tropicalis TaxID=1561998 RepID=A0A1I7UN68_9PELO